MRYNEAATAKAGLKTMLAGFVSATVLCLIGVFIVYSVMKSQWGFGWRLLTGSIGLLLFLFGVGNFLLLLHTT